MKCNIIKYINITECYGAVSVDFLLSMFVIIIVVQSVVALTEDRMDTVKDTEELGGARIIAENVAETIDVTYSGGEGHSTYITLPPNVNGKDYEITVNSSGVFVEVEGMIGKAWVIPKSISSADSPEKSEYILNPQKTYKISNEKNGESHYKIIITQLP